MFGANGFQQLSDAQDCPKLPVYESPFNGFEGWVAKPEASMALEMAKRTNQLMNSCRPVEDGHMFLLATNRLSETCVPAKEDASERPRFLSLPSTPYKTTLLVSKAYFGTLHLF